jgi:hypothetical protein
MKTLRQTAYLLPLLLVGCATTYQAPASGPTASLTVSSSTLQRRSGIFVDEYLHVTVDAGSQTSGLLKLTVERDSLSTSIPAGRPVTLRFEKLVPLLGTMISCSGLVTLEPVQGQQIKAQFDFSYDLTTHRASDCVVEVTTPTATGPATERHVLQRARTTYGAQVVR